MKTPPFFYASIAMNLVMGGAWLAEWNANPYLRFWVIEHLEMLIAFGAALFIAIGGGSISRRKIVNKSIAEKGEKDEKEKEEATEPDFYEVH